jgi:xanthine dehydrogenase YagS FAD-binding subunit
MDWALSAVAAVVTFKGNRVEDASVCLGGVAPIPWVVEQAPSLLNGQRVNPPLLDKLADAAVADADPLEYNGYKVPLTKTLVKRAIQGLMD